MSIATAEEMMLVGAVEEERVEAACPVTLDLPREKPTDLRNAAEAIKAAYPAALNLPPGKQDDLRNAAGAIKQEHRSSSRGKRLHCRTWEHVQEREDGSIYVLNVGRSVEFDWTWEGAVAYRPFLTTGSFPDGLDGEPDEEKNYWFGEVVEVDQTGGRIFVSISDPEKKPTTGTFYVRPFEFLALLYKVYNDRQFEDVRKPLISRLRATEGEACSRLDDPVGQGLPELQAMWDHAWGILWGPPGTGKTYSIGQQVARCLGDSAERILVVSTTNKATDGAALEIGKACRALSNSAHSDGRVLRVGKGVELKRFDQESLDRMVRGTETDLLRQAGELKEKLDRTSDWVERAKLQAQIKELLQRIGDVSRHVFRSSHVDVVVTTAFRATSMLDHPEFREMIEKGQAPFTTVIIDEAGLISRAATAVLSLLASKRLVLVGDPKQLAPISRMSRALPTSEARWLGSSGLAHLRKADLRAEGVHLLKTQYRMHPEVCEVVSRYQYGGLLDTADGVRQRAYSPPALIRDCPRAIWYVLDEDKGSLPSIRAERGPGNRSWARKGTRDILDKLFSDERFRQSNGLFISPFAAQAKNIASYFAEKRYECWRASTVHSQQGAEADIVVFDTVNASSTSWSLQEWMRLVNVGLSRAREFVVVLASRAEMQSPFMRPLAALLKPMVLARTGSAWRWVDVEAVRSYEVPETVAANPELLGHQIAERKSMRPILSAEQQRLVGYKMDGKPRLVRGVAGSGKTVVLAHWLCKTLDQIRDDPNAKIWAVYANRALEGLVKETIQAAWDEDHTDQPLPWDRAELFHIKDLLELLLPQVDLSMAKFKYEYDQASAAYLRRMGDQPIQPCCSALFADEAQDLGPNTIKLLNLLVQGSGPEHPNNRPIHIFYDNAQNVYGRDTPKWSDIGLNMVGRSTIMKESFRSTKPITELAFNVLHRLCPEESQSQDHKELIELGLVEQTKRKDTPWWDIRFNRIDGPVPTFRKFPTMDDQFNAVGEELVRWIVNEGVKPSDIRVIGLQNRCLYKLQTHIESRLARIGVDFQVQTRQTFIQDGRTVIATTPHSFKGHEAEVILVPCVEQFQAKGKLFPQALYVAMTRARTVLALFGKDSKKDGDREILKAIGDCFEAQGEIPKVEPTISEAEEFEDIHRMIGTPCKKWLDDQRRDHKLIKEPMLAEDRSILCEPLFWYEEKGRRFACFARGEPSQRTRYALEDAGVMVLEPDASE